MFLYSNASTILPHYSLTQGHFDRKTAFPSSIQQPLGLIGDTSDDVFISCVIPCFNEHDSLQILLPRLRDQLNALSTRCEVIVIDDGSSDDTPDLLALGTAHDGFRYIQFSRNFGKEAALSAGLSAAAGDVAVLLDADMQHPPSLIRDMLDKWRRGAEMVFALRAHRNDEPRLNRFGTRWFYRLLSFSDAVQIPAHAGDFRLMDRCVVDALLALPERTRFMKGLYAWVGFRTESISSMPDARVCGRSRYKPWQLTRLAISGITAFTTWSLRIVSLQGFLFALLSFTYGRFLVLNYCVRSPNENLKMDKIS